MMEGDIMLMYFKEHQQRPKDAYPKNPPSPLPYICKCEICEMVRQYFGYLVREKPKLFQDEWKAMTCPDCEGKGSCPFCSSTGKVYERKNNE
jgi:hypothetical protein